MTFDGSNDQLIMSSSTGPRTVFMVNRPTTFTTGNGPWGYNGGDKGIRLGNATNYNTVGDANDFTNGQNAGTGEGSCTSTA